MDEYRIQLTGEVLNENYKIVEVPFSNYIVKLQLDEKDKFKKILEIVELKNFYNYKTKNISQGKNDFEAFYKLEEE